MSGAPHTLWADNPDRVISDISGSRVDIGVYPKASTKADMPFALSLTTEDKTVAPFATASSSPRHRRWKAVVALAHRLAAEAHMQSLDGTVWRLIEASAFDDDGHELSPPLGKHPMGFVMFEAERIIVAVVDGGLSLPANVSSRAFVAYSGTYRFDGVELVTNVDGASSSKLVGQQIRHIHFESPTRMVVMPKNKVLGRDAGLKFVWERIG